MNGAVVPSRAGSVIAGEYQRNSGVTANSALWASMA